MRNAEHKLVVTTTHDNLRRDPKTGSAGSVYIDTDRSDKGPEFVFVGGYYAGTDYQLLHTAGTSNGLVDWLGEPHSFTPWIARG